MNEQMEASPPLDRYVLRLYKILKHLYPQGTSEKPLVARFGIQDILAGIMLKKDLLYQRMYRQFYVFYGLFAQNTRDTMTLNALKKIYEEIISLNYVYELQIYEKYFYKHRERNYAAFKSILSLLEELKQRTIAYDEFRAVSGVGFKTAALYYNEFIEQNLWPVVDVHVQKGYNELLRKIQPIESGLVLKPLTQEKLFLKLVDLSVRSNFNMGYRFASVLYYHRRYICYCKYDSSCCKNCKWIVEHYNYSLEEQSLDHP